MQYLTIGLIKIIDNIIMTGKTIATYKGFLWLSILLTTISQFMYYFIICEVVEDGSLLMILIVSVTSGIGTGIALLINDKFKKDVKWTNILTCSDMEDIDKLIDELLQHKIKYIVNDSYTRKGQKTYSVLVFALNKNESKVIDEYLSKTQVKYLRQILK